MRKVMFCLVAVVLLGSVFACATLRSPNDPVPTRRPPTPTLTSTPNPFLFGG